MRFKKQISVAAIVMAVLLIAACPQSGTDTGSGEALKPKGNTPAGTTTPPGSGGSTQASGWTGNARDFAFTGFNGSSGKISDYAGKPVVVNFWATW